MAGGLDQGVALSDFNAAENLAASNRLDARSGRVGTALFLGIDDGLQSKAEGDTGKGRIDENARRAENERGQRE